MAAESLLSRLTRTVLAAGLWGCAMGAQGQSFNVDVDLYNSPPEVGGGAPSSAFGAAAESPGFWNAFPAGARSPFHLLDVTGGDTAVYMVGTGSGGTGGWNNRSNTGDYNLLLNDVDRVGPNFSYSIYGLQAGLYTVYTYST